MLPSLSWSLLRADGVEVVITPLHWGALTAIVATIFALGALVGYVFGRRRHGRPTKGSAQHEGGGATGRLPRRKNIHSLDGSTMVLNGSLELMASKWGGDEFQNPREVAVVEYLSPEEMSRMLFKSATEHGFGSTLSLDESDRDLSPKSSATDLTSLVSIFEKGRSIGREPEKFIKLLELIQKYSVNTSHPYFFNQLFGSLDPIALAAEIVALSVNTSVYTYETAPVFTLIEREVMGQIGKLVFGPTPGKQISFEADEKFEGEGLMIPGGSLANLTAMHAARHRWKVMNGFIKQASEDTEELLGMDWSTFGEEKKSDDVLPTASEKQGKVIATGETLYDYNRSAPDMVAFVSSEAHYSFSKSARVLGLREDDLVIIPTHPDGRMNVKELAKRIEEIELESASHLGARIRVPFFVACTAGSTVRGSFDEIEEIVKVCRSYEARANPSEGRSIWVHVDGAWGGSAIFSSRRHVRDITHMDEIRHADSFTFNPHKMLGAPQQTTAFIVRHRHALKCANSAGAKYLFDPRKNGAEYDLGDLSYTCGRRTDAVKLWAMWKYYGKSGLGERVDQKVDELQLFVDELRGRPSFALACTPWPFNVNFFYFPPRIRAILEARGLVKNDRGDEVVQIPDDVAQDMSNVSVQLKLRLHEAGEMIIPYQVSFGLINLPHHDFLSGRSVSTDVILPQPLTNQKADCFRLVLAGKKDFGLADIRHILDTMERYGRDL